MGLPQRKDPEPWRSDPAADEGEGGVIFRTTVDGDGKVRVLTLPPTRENVLDVRLEDQVAQTNPHARTLSPMAVALRDELETREGARYGVFEDLLLLLKRHGYDRDVASDIVVCAGVANPEAVGESLDVIAKAYPVLCAIEVVSTKYKAHRDKDEIDNAVLYERLGAEDYVLVYPKVESRGESLRLAAKTRGRRGSFIDNPPDPRGRIRIRSLDIWIYVDEQGRLALQDIGTGNRIWFHVDQKRLRLVAEARAQEAESRAEQAERRAEEEAEARREAEGRLTEEARRAEDAGRRADDAERRAEDAEARVRAETIVLVLESRGLILTDAERQRILTCRAADTLRRWTAAAATVRIPADLWDASQ